MLFIYLLIGLMLLAAVGMAVRWFATAAPRQVATAAKIGAGLGGGLAALLLLVTGRVGSALVLWSYLAPLLRGLRGAWTRMGNAAGPAAGQTSDIETAYLRMRLHHDTGVMEGSVAKGPFAGRQLHELTLADLQGLLATLRAEDGDGAAILEAYLDRTQPEWRSQGAGAAAAGAAEGSAPSAAMTREEAYRILGLAPGASESEIRDAHRRLMVKLHPDQGGSDYLAAKINEARDLLLAR